MRTLPDTSGIWRWPGQSLVISPLTTATRQLGNSATRLDGYVDVLASVIKDAAETSSVLASLWVFAWLLDRILKTLFLKVLRTVRLFCSPNVDSSNFQDFPMAMWRVSIPVVLRPVRPVIYGDCCDS